MTPPTPPAASPRAAHRNGDELAVEFHPPAGGAGRASCRGRALRACTGEGGPAAAEEAVELLHRAQRALVHVLVRHPAGRDLWGPGPARHGGVHEGKIHSSQGLPRI